MSKKKVISALAPLRPIQIIDLETGEIVSHNDHDSAITSLITYVKNQTTQLYQTNRNQLKIDITTAKNISSANSFGRKHGYASNYKLLPKQVKAKSRINELILHKLITETASYVKSPNPRKQPPSFGPKINLGAVDSQMASLSIDNNILTLRFKAWDKDFLLDFRIPEYALKRKIIKWSLPTIELRNGKPYYIFTMQEVPLERTQSGNIAGIDLGRVEPYTMVIVNKHGSRIADYRARSSIRQLNDKREHILKEKAFILKKAVQYEKLGLDSKVLRREARFKGSKAAVLAVEVARQVGGDVARKLAMHELNLLAVEDLSWVRGAKYGSRWNHSVVQEKIEHSVSRVGVRVKKVSPKNTSQLCHVCKRVVVHNSVSRVVKCVDCKAEFDRDFNAAMNIARKVNSYPNRYGRIGNDCSSTEQVIEPLTHNSDLRSITRNTT